MHVATFLLLHNIAEDFIKKGVRKMVLRKRKGFAIFAIVLLLFLAACSNTQSESSDPSSAIEASSIMVSSTAFTSSVVSSETSMPESEPEVSSVQPIESSAAPEPAESLPAENTPAEYELNVQTILQLPELPTGCEITSLTMALRYMGYDVDKTTMSGEYLPTSNTFYYVGDKKYGPDFREVFAGYPESDKGCECNAPAIVDAANNYLTAINSPQRAVNLSGSDPQTLYDAVRADTPVVVWITINMADRIPSGGWYVEDTDEYIEWAAVDHCAVLMGFGEDYVELNDPLAGIVSYSKTLFEDIYRQRGMQAVIVQ